jgi:anaerobic selenocysteine-containing dehydrogenase
VVLVFGDLFAEHPCTAKDVLPMRSVSRSSGMIVVSPEENNTSWFATTHLRCKPAGEAAVAAGLLKAAAGGVNLPADLSKFIEGTGWNEIERFGGVAREDIENAAKSLLGAAKVQTYISNIFGRIAGLDVASLFAEALTKLCPGDSEFIPQFVQQNTWGIYSTLARSGTVGLLGKLESSEIKALVILGLDIFSAYPAGPVEKALREKKFTVTTQVFWNQTASRANVVVPSSILVEKKGTVSPAFGEDLERDGSLDPPGGAVSDAEFLTALAREMGSDLSASAADRVTARSGSGEWLGESWNLYASEMGALDTAETVMIPWSEAVHAADGSVSRNLHWSDVTSPEPLLYLSKDFAGELGLSDGDTVSVTSEGGEAVLAVKSTSRLEDKMVGATIHFPAVRKLFPWKLDERSGEIRLAPVGVRLGRQSEKS